MRNHLVVNERREVSAISEISINWDIRVKETFYPSSARSCRIQMAPILVLRNSS
nr:MAG TPA: hypothetical protein [Caudoviricetes sp.]